MILRHGLTLCRLVVFSIAMFSVAAVFSDEINNVPSAGNISSSDDCTEININYKLDGKLTREEAISRMDEAFYESLSKFDACQVSQSSASDNASASSGGGSNGAGSNGSGANEMGAGEAGSSGISSVASPDMSGTSAPIENGVSATATSKGGDVSTVMSARGIKKNIRAGTQTGSGKIPEDIPSADNDSVLQAQIRQAAMNETDPETRKKLWNEYRKYKGLSQPGN